jgi:hypothetical protein
MRKFTEPDKEKEMRALFVFTNPEAKRFIAKAVAQLPEVKKAKKDGEIVIGHGSTNVFVAEEVMGGCPKRNQYLSGVILNGILCVTQAEEKPPMLMLRKGKQIPPKPTMEETLEKFNADSVFIKGANAIDLNGNAGVFVANPSGGTVGWAYGILMAKGSHLIVPCSLAKLVPSVQKAAKSVGQKTLYYCQGIKIGMVPIMNAKVVTEIDAFRILFDLDAVYIGAGGQSGSEGSVVMAVEGSKKALDLAIKLIESIKGEPPLSPKKSLCNNCVPTIPSVKDLSIDKNIMHCMYQGKEEEDLTWIARKKRA